MSFRRRLGFACPALAALTVAVVAGGGHTSPPPVAGTEMTTAGRATVRGRVTLEGPAPDVADLDRKFLTARSLGADADVCARAPADENRQQTWRIGDKGAVANVVVWLRPADGSHFVMEKEDLHPKTRTWQEVVAVSQRHLNYSPHVATLFPSHFDPVSKKQVPTGQVLKVTNPSPVVCNAHIDGGPDNPGDNVVILPHKEQEFRYQPARRPMVLMDSIHPWMRGFAWVFDHPYAAVTDQSGRYEIRKVPTGRVLRLMAWHEETGYLYGRDGIAVELKDGNNRKDLRVRADR
jgi:hypothetical protein